MTSQIFFKNLWAFIKDQFREILMLTIVLALVFGGLLYMLFNIRTPQTEGIVEEAAHYEEILNQKPGQFNFVIMNNITGEGYTNSYIFEDYFKTPKYLDDLEKITGVDLAPVIEFEEDNVVKNIYNRGVVGFIRNTSSNVITASFKIGSEEQNLKAAKYYYSQLTENAEDIPMLYEKTLIPLTEPNMASKVFPGVEDNESQTAAPTQEAPVINWPVLIILALVAAGFLSFILVFLWQFFRSKLNYAFAFSWDGDDTFIQAEKGQDPAITAYHLTKPDLDSRIILKQPDTLEHLSVYPMYSSLEQFDGLDQPKECIILLEANQTDKDWYHVQRVLLENFPNTHIKLVHFL